MIEGVQYFFDWQVAVEVILVLFVNNLKTTNEIPPKTAAHQYQPP